MQGSTHALLLIVEKINCFPFRLATNSDTTFTGTKDGLLANQISQRHGPQGDSIDNRLNSEQFHVSIRRIQQHCAYPFWAPFSGHLTLASYLGMQSGLVRNVLLIAGQISASFWN